jgi:hypothetical protein
VPMCNLPPGCAPVTETYARLVGADGYAPDASSAVAAAKALLGADNRVGSSFLYGTAWLYTNALLMDSEFRLDRSKKLSLNARNLLAYEATGCNVNMVFQRVAGLLSLDYSYPTIFL